MKQAPAPPQKLASRLGWMLMAALLGLGARHLISPLGPIQPMPLATPQATRPLLEQAPSGAAGEKPKLCYTGGSDDLRASLEQIFQEYPGDFNDSRVYLLARSLTAEQRKLLPEVIAEYFQKTDREWVASSLLQGWAEVDGIAAMDYLTAQPPQLAKPSLLGDVLTAWARTQPEAAGAWLEARPLSALTSKLRASWLTSMAEENPAEAFAAARAKGWLTADSRIAQGIFANWAIKDFAGAWAALNAAKEEGLRPGAWAHYLIGNARFTEASFRTPDLARSHLSLFFGKPFVWDRIPLPLDRLLF